MGLDQSKLDEAYERAKQDSAGGGEFWTPKVGDNLIRFMPPWKEGLGVFFVETFHHWKLIEEPICCPRRMFGQRCYLCEKVKELRASGDAVDNKKARDISAKKDVYYNIVDLNEPGKGVQIYRSGGGVFTDILIYAKDTAEYPDITDPDKGFNFKIIRTGEGLDTKYTIMAARKPSAIKDKGWLKQLNDLDERVTIQDYEAQKSLYGHLFGEGPAPEGFKDQGEAETEDEFEEHSIEKALVPDDEVGTIKAAYCVQFAKFGQYNEDKKLCQSCTIKDQCAAATKGKGEEPTQDIKGLKQTLKDAGK